MYVPYIFMDWAPPPPKKQTSCCSIHMYSTAEESRTHLPAASNICTETNKLNAIVAGINQLSEGFDKNCIKQNSLRLWPDVTLRYELFHCKCAEGSKKGFSAMQTTLPKELTFSPNIFVRIWRAEQYYFRTDARENVSHFRTKRSYVFGAFTLSQEYILFSSLLCLNYARSQFNTTKLTNTYWVEL